MLADFPVTALVPACFPVMYVQRWPDALAVLILWPLVRVSRTAPRAFASGTSPLESSSRPSRPITAADRLRFALYQRGSVARPVRALLIDGRSGSGASGDRYSLPQCIARRRLEDGGEVVQQASSEEQVFPALPPRYPGRRETVGDVRKVYRRPSSRSRASTSSMRTGMVLSLTPLSRPS